MPRAFLVPQSFWWADTEIRTVLSHARQDVILHRCNPVTPPCPCIQPSLWSPAGHPSGLGRSQGASPPSSDNQVPLSGQPGGAASFKGHDGDTAVPSTKYVVLRTYTPRLAGPSSPRLEPLPSPSVPNSPCEIAQIALHSLILREMSKLPGTHMTTRPDG